MLRISMMTTSCSKHRTPQDSPGFAVLGFPRVFYVFSKLAVAAVLGSEGSLHFISENEDFQ